MIEEFIEFCRSKGDEAYDYLDTDRCAVAQFLIASKRSLTPNCSRDGYFSESSVKMISLPLGMDDLAVDYPRTFAGIVARYEEQK